MFVVLYNKQLLQYTTCTVYTTCIDMCLRKWPFNVKKIRRSFWPFFNVKFFIHIRKYLYYSFLYLREAFRYYTERIFFFEISKYEMDIFHEKTAKLANLTNTGNTSRKIKQVFLKLFCYYHYLKFSNSHQRFSKKKKNRKQDFLFEW